MQMRSHFTENALQIPEKKGKGMNEDFAWDKNNTFIAKYDRQKNKYYNFCIVQHS